MKLSNELAKELIQSAALPESNYHVCAEKHGYDSSVPPDV